MSMEEGVVGVEKGSKQYLKINIRDKIGQDLVHQSECVRHWAEGQHIIKWSSILPRAHRYYQIESSNVI